MIRNKPSLRKRFLALTLVLAMVLTLLPGCEQKVVDTPNPSASIPIEETIPSIGNTNKPDAAPVSSASVTERPAQNDEPEDEINWAEVSRSLIIADYNLYYDVFDAAVVLGDKTEIVGIGYSDFSSYFESEDGDRCFFSAGFLSECAEIPISEDEYNNGLIVYNLDYEDDTYGFVCTYGTEPYMNHCVINGQYLKYGVDEFGVISYEVQPYEKDHCDESLGALFSYDENRYVFNPNVGEYLYLTGTSLSEQLDYVALEEEVNRILAEQDQEFVRETIDSAFFVAQEAVASYLLSLQAETFLGYDTELLIAEIQQLDSNEFIRISPDGYFIIPIEDEIPESPTDLAKWTVGISCGIVVICSTALTVFMPAARPLSGAITGAAIDVFMQVVIENHAVADIQWSKVAVAATTGALMAWACPLAASTVTTSVGHTTGSIALSKLAGYGVLTVSNSVVSGATNAALALIDEKSGEDVWNAFIVGAAVGACCTAAASILSEVARPIGNAVSNAVNAKFPNNFLARAESSVSTFIGTHQVHLSNASLEEILNPKSVYAAAQAAHEEYLYQVASKGTAVKQGGSYSELTTDGMEKHETPCFSSTGEEKRGKGPSIRMLPEDHHKTASYGHSKDAQAYQAAQRELFKAGRCHEAIQMDIDDIQSKFGHKYDDAIEQMLKYAESIGWW